MANPDSPDITEVQRDELMKKLDPNRNPQGVADDARKVADQVRASLGGSAPRPMGRITPENVREAFTYAAWDQSQVDAGKEVTEALIAAAATVLRVVPESPLRTRAINGLFDACMLANAAITHRGKF